MSKISRKQLAKVIADQMGEKSSKQLAEEVAHYLLKEKRTADLAPLMRDIEALRAQQGLVEANVASAHELGQDIQALLMRLATQDYPEYERVILNQEHDSALVGGLRLTAIDRQVDLSVKNRLRRLVKARENN